jgi:hypothetical protein
MFLACVVVFGCMSEGCSGGDPVQPPPYYTVMYDSSDGTKGFYWDMARNGDYTMYVWQKEEGEDHSVGVTGSYSSSEEEDIREALRDFGEPPVNADRYAQYVVFKGDDTSYVVEGSRGEEAIREVITRAFERGEPDEGPSTQAYDARRWHVQQGQ